MPPPYLIPLPSSSHCTSFLGVFTTLLRLKRAAVRPMAFLSGGHFLTASHCKLRLNTEGMLLARAAGHQPQQHREFKYHPQMQHPNHEMNSAIALMTSHNIVNSNSILKCKIMSENEHRTTVPHLHTNRTPSSIRLVAKGILAARERRAPYLYTPVVCNRA